MNEPVKESSPDHRNNTLSAFIDESKARLKEILKRLEWNTELDIYTDTVLKNEEQKEPQIASDSEPDFPPSFASQNFIVTGVDELRKVLGVPDKDVPKRFSDVQLNFTRTEKLTLYEHVIANTKKCTEPEITVQSVGEGPLTFAEIVAQKRRETKKRRRYRQSKPTHIEEVRAIVDLQMQSLQQYLKEKDADMRKYQPMLDERYRSDKVDLCVRGSNRRTDTTQKLRTKHRSRSRSFERKSRKKSRHRSRSASNSHKHKYRKKYASDRSSSRNRKCRSRSRSKTRRKTHKRRGRSKTPSKSKRRSRSPSNNRNKLHHRQGNDYRSYKVS